MVSRKTPTTKMKKNKKILTSFLALTVTLQVQLSAQPRSFSGIYPNLAMYNNEGECGTGAVVPWNNKLYVITYGPHLPLGSSDKLYMIDEDKQAIVYDQSVGGPQLIG